MHVIQIGFGLDPLRRNGQTLLDAWSTLREVACAANGEGVRVTVVQPAHEDTVIEHGGVAFHFVAAGAREVRVSGRSADLLRRTARRSAMRTHIRAADVRVLLQRASVRRPDLLHVHGLSLPLQTRALVRACPGVPILVQDHGSRPPALWKRPIHRWGLAPIASVAFTAREQAGPFVAAGVLRPDLPVLEVLESSSRFQPADLRAARARTGLNGDPCLVWIGRLDENKDPLTVLEAVSRALPELPGTRLWCCYTDAPLLDAVRARLAAESVLAERVQLLGTVSHEVVQDVLSAADFLVSGSHAEGSGFAVIEALACGATPIVTDIPPFRRITAGGAMGGLTPPGDAAAMARELIKWAARDRIALRRAARAHFESALSFEAVGAELRAAYRAVVKRDPRSAFRQIEQTQRID